jgi:hypothetical protein
MTILKKIDEQLVDAMRNKDTAKLTVLRSLKAAVGIAAKAAGSKIVDGNMSDQDIVPILRKQIASRQDSIAQFAKGNRDDLVKIEEAEIVVLESFLPTQLDDAGVDKVVKAAIEQAGATTKKDMGRTIKLAVELANGGTDPKTLSTKIGALLQ